MGAAAVIVRRQDRWMKRFRELDAISPENAVPAEEIASSDSWVFNRMVSKGVFKPTADGKFYMDEVMAGQFRKIRRTKIAAFVLVGLTIYVLVLIIGN